jgi:outer membrane protein OmpA-like peptidoglycan-associated protein
MTTDSKATAGSPSPNAAQRAWLSEMSKLMGGGGIDFGAAVKAHAAPGGAGAPAPGGPGAPAPDACVTPDATASDFFFDYNSAELTASDKTFLEAYASAYLRLKISQDIVVEGFASIDGDPGWNQTLSSNRAAAVTKFLAKKLPKAKVKSIGKGPTSDFPGDLCQNRRATIKPVLELKVSDFVGEVKIEPPNDPPRPPGSLGEKAPVVTDFDIPEPCPMVSRDVVEAALTKWLIELGQAQKLTTKQKDAVKTTARVHLAEQTLLGKVGEDGDTRMGAHGRRCGREELEQQAITPFDGDDKTHDAAVLAKTITRNFPERIAQQNLDNFLKLRPREAPGELSIDEQIRAKADSLANQVLSDFGVPKKYWGDIKDWVKKKIPGRIDELKVSDEVKKGLKKAYNKLAGIKDDEN